MTFTNCSFMNNQQVLFVQGASTENRTINISNSHFEGNINIGAINVLFMGIFIDNTTFLNNNGALFMTGSNATITNCHFYENTIYSSGGGAIYFDAAPVSALKPVQQILFISKSKFLGNSAVNSFGGSIYSAATHFNMTIVSSEFSLSSATNGGALGFTENTQVPSTRYVTIDSCTFENNSATTNGGTIYATDFISFSINRTVFKGSSCTQQGGALYIDSAKMAVQNSFFEGCNSGLDGGAIYIAGNGNTTFVDYEFTNVSFHSNGVALRSGGAITFALINPVPTLLSDCSFENNSAFSFGGAIYSTSYSQPNLVNSTFSFNSANQGGALYVDEHSQLNCQLLNFTSNTAFADGGAVSLLGLSQASLVSATFHSNFAGNGGAISVHAQANASFNSCTFFSNGANSNGGAVYIDTLIQSPQFYECVFSSNIAPNGGAFAVVAASPLIVQSNFSENFANLSGGGVYLSGQASPEFRQAQIFGNSATVSGGGIFCEESSSLILNSSVLSKNFAVQGGAIGAQQGCEPRLYATEFMDNGATDSGGAIFLQGNVFSIMENSFRNNSAENGAGIFFANGMDKSSIFSDTLFQLNSAENGGGAFMWDLGSTTRDLQQNGPQCTMCSYDHNSASYGKDFATKITHIEFETPPPLDVFDGIVGPYKISVLDFYNQTVCGIEPAQVRVAISPFHSLRASNESMPILTGSTHADVINGTALFSQLEISGMFETSYLLTFSLSVGPALASVQDLTIPITYHGCGVGEEGIATTNYGVCRQCLSGFYNLNGNGSCLPCPPNAICNGGSDIRAKDNFYLLDESGMASTYVCPNGMCKNGTCTARRSGVLCGVCEEGYQSTSSGSCVECRKSHNSKALFGDIALLWLFVVVLQFSSKLPSRLPGHDRHAISGLTNIILFFLQTVSLVATPKETLERLFSFFDFQFFLSFSQHCALKLDFFGNFLLSILMPLILLGILIVNLALQIIVHFFSKCCNERLAEYTKVNKTTYIRTICSLVLFSYSHVTQAVFSFVNCRSVGPYRVVASSPDISCASTRYKHWSIFAYILFSYVLLLPVGLLIILVEMYKRQKLNSSSFAEKYGVLFQCFKTKSYYWQVVILVRRLLFIMIFVVAFSAPFAQSLALCIFATLILCMHLCIRPFFFEIDNVIETALLSFLVIIAGIHSAAANSDFHHQIDTFSAVVTILAVVPIGIGLFFQLQFILVRLGLIKRQIGFQEDVPLQKIESPNSSGSLQPSKST
eukprot:Phypoly_transcript_00848.p1 GENE.Phypoly_transcript_00848~~Phypoly_transcript_00848.p1  ORF type:complete len:1242 (+),score=130.10 Phypoly_transcript_00848:178-3903(+)